MLDIDFYNSPDAILPHHSIWLFYRAIRLKTFTKRVLFVNMLFLGMATSIRECLYKLCIVKKSPTLYNAVFVASINSHPLLHKGTLAYTGLFIKLTPLLPEIVRE